MVKLTEVAEVNPRCPKDIDEDQLVSFVAMASASEEGLLLNEESRVLKDTKKGFTYFERGDVLLAKITPCFENGKSLRPYQISNRVGFGSTEFHVLRANMDKLDPTYLFYMVWNDAFRFIGTNAMAGAAGQKRVGTPFLKQLEIPLPPLAEQKRIAAILDKADAIRQKRKQAIELADEFLRSVFLDMFGDPVTNPKGLKKAPITELADIITGFAFKSSEYITESEDSVRLCRGANTLTGYFDWSDTVFWPKGKLEKLERYLICEKDIILAMDRPWISSGLKVCIFPENEPSTYLVQRVARLRPKLQIFSDYIYSCIKSQSFEKHCCPTETTVPHISPVELKEFEVLIPDERLLIQYHTIVSMMNQVMQSMGNCESDGGDIFNSLSQKAFSGQL
ncbi:restriction endonuclease subunit S [Vibrio furnissii]|uniref:restriction endonuclease subunit S n=1 Tax=Vibrio furnissii TaxID=29494 RepID=UPI00399C2117